MRLWSVHPKQLDHVALVSVWREGLLAKKVLEGNTQGYRNHPQLNRFKTTGDPLAAITMYLHAVVDEADGRGYKFDRTKLGSLQRVSPIPLHIGQLDYEWRHLLQKSFTRTPQHHTVIVTVRPEAHPLFRLVDGPVEDWERV